MSWRLRGRPQRASPDRPNVRVQTQSTWSRARERTSVLGPLQPASRGGRERAGSDRLDVNCVGALGPVLGVVADLRAFGQRLEPATGDAGVMHEQILALIVGRNEPEALLVTEPLYGSRCHESSRREMCGRNVGGAMQPLRTLAPLSPAKPPDTTTLAAAGGCRFQLSTDAAVPG